MAVPVSWRTPAAATAGRTRDTWWPGTPACPEARNRRPPPPNAAAPERCRRRPWAPVPINHGFLAEEHHGRVGIEHFRHALRVALRPGADVLHGGLVGRQFAPVDQPAANGRVGLAVVIGVGHADGLARIGAVGQQHAARTLHLQKEVVHRIVHPHQHGRTAARGLDGGAGVVGHDALAVELAAHALAGQFGYTDPRSMVSRSAGTVYSGH